MMIDADKLPLRRITRVRRHQKGGKPWYARERVCVVLEADLKEEIRRKPRNRMERIQRMSLDELAKTALALCDGESLGYCHMKPECMAALGENKPEAITDGHCLQCLKEWLLEEI